MFQFCVCYLNIHIATVWRERLAGGNFGKLTRFEHLRKKLWRINRSVNRLLIISTNLAGFSLANHGRFAKICQRFPPLKFPSIWYCTCVKVK